MTLPSGQGRASLRALESPSLLPQGRSRLWPCRLRTWASRVACSLFPPRYLSDLLPRGLLLGAVIFGAAVMAISAFGCIGAAGSHEAIKLYAALLIPSLLSAAGASAPGLP